MSCSKRIRDYSKVAAALLHRLRKLVLHNVCRQGCEFPYTLAAKPESDIRTGGQHDVTCKTKARPRRFARILLTCRHQHETFSERQQNPRHNVDRHVAEFP